MDTNFEEARDGFQAIRYDGQAVELLDQRCLPGQETWLRCPDCESVGRAISDLVVRGAPAIGITAAYGVALAARARKDDINAWHRDLDRLKQARPTAVNLAWAIERMRALANDAGKLDAHRLDEEAARIHREDIEANRSMAKAGSALIESGSGVLTHCNTGSLATGGIGTALGVVLEGVASGRVSQVYADETRPWLQGSRLTAWELARAGVPFQVLVEGAAASLMQAAKVQWVITGADRIAANGDVANKIGTYALAVLARHHGVKMMVVAPSSTLDPNMPDGRGIEIEQRDPDEIWRAAAMSTPPTGFSAWNPVFDITPSSLIDCIVTEQGAWQPPFDFS